MKLAVPALAGVIALCTAGHAAAQSTTSTPDEVQVRAAEHEARVKALQSRAWEITAVRVQAPVRFDGVLDEDAWAQAPPITEFYQRFRRDPIPASERTEIRLLYDDNYLYIGIRAFESHPELMEIRGIFRDEVGQGDDAVITMLDAYHGHRSAVQLNSNANGLLYDMLQTGENEKTRNADFNMVWDSRGHRTGDGYEIEERVPFKSLRFAPRGPGEEVIFGIGFKRNIVRKNEEAMWPFVSIDSSWYRPAELGHVRGLFDVHPGRNLELRPYILGGADQNLVTDVTDGKREVGLDVKWGVTTGLTADFTINTDFAQEEADVQQVNFTRFSLFFPEKRQFFLEGQQMFQFGLAQEADLAFTRRIGLSNSGLIVPIDVGARLSGRQGRTSLGLMNIQTGDEQGIPGENFTLLRVKRDVLSRSSVGAIFTDVEGANSFNRVYGADAGFYVHRYWFFDGFAAAQDDSKLPRSGVGYGRFAFERDKWASNYRLLSVGQAFNPGIGFVRRPDSRQHEGVLRYSPRPKSKTIRQFNFTGTLDYITDQQNVLQTRNQQLVADTEFESGKSVIVTALKTMESITKPFRLRANLSIPPGVYRFSTVSFQAQTATRTNMSYGATYTTGGFWDGTRDTLSLKASYRPTTHFGLSGNYDVNWIDLPEGKWTSQLASSRVILALRSDLALQGLLQYNNDTRQVSSNLRFTWIPKPGTNLFVVYNELDTETRHPIPLNRSFAVKLNYLFGL